MSEQVARSIPPEDICKEAEQLWATISQIGIQSPPNAIAYAIWHERSGGQSSGYPFPESADVSSALAPRASDKSGVTDMSSKSEIDNGWLPIETAPKDGTEVDLYCINFGGLGERWCNARWDYDDWAGPWSDGYDCPLPDPRATPTHWMLPPKPPGASS